MKRRDFLQLAAAAPLLTLPTGAAAWMSCGPFTINGGKYCYAGIRASLTHVPAAGPDERHRVRWCWAACAQMVLGYRGLALDQQRIVTEAWGSITAVPTAHESVAAGLDRDWVDAAGTRFRVRAELLPVTPDTAARVLRRDAPLVVATRTHPVVLTTLRYVGIRGDDAHSRIQNAEVHDPWPGRARRFMSQAEWRDAAGLLHLRIG